MKANEAVIAKQEFMKTGLGGFDELLGHGLPLGFSATKMYSVWRGMMRRCYEKGDKSYQRYAGRGITVTKRWHKFVNFRQDMLPSFKEGLTLERTNNDLGYSNSNCRWATPKEQANNRRGNKFLSHDGKRMTKSQWAAFLGLNRDTFGWRIKKHGICDKVFTTTKFKHL